MNAFEAIVALVAIGFTPKDAMSLLVESGLNFKSPDFQISQDRLRLEIDEWAERPVMKS